MPDVPDGVVAPVSEQPEFKDFNEFEAWKRDGSKPVEQKEAAPTKEEGKTAEESDTSDSEQGESRERDETGRFKPKKPEAEKRIDKLTAKWREAERERDELRRQLEESRAPKPAEEKKPDAKPEAAADKPKVADFNTYEEYVEALTDWKTDQKLAKVAEAEAAKAREKSEAEQQKTVSQKWQDSEAEVRKAHSDYDDAIQEAAEEIKAGKLPPLSNEAFAAIMETDSKAELFYHLAKNRADLERLANAPANRVMYELGKIEAKLTTAPVQQKETKVLPKPPATVGGTAKGGSSADATDFNTYYNRRQAELHRR